MPPGLQSNCPRRYPVFPSYLGLLPAKHLPHKFTIIGSPHTRSRWYLTHRPLPQVNNNRGGPRIRSPQYIHRWIPSSTRLVTSLVPVATNLFITFTVHALDTHSTYYIPKRHFL